MSMVYIEAVQLGRWGRWHAVRPGEDDTFCGRSAMKAIRMWHDWDEEQWDRCRRCQRGVVAAGLRKRGKVSDHVDRD